MVLKQIKHVKLDNSSVFFIIGRSLIKYRFRQFLKGEWSKQPFRVWYNSGTEIWITAFNIRKQMQSPCSYSAGCLGENSWDPEIHFGGLCGTWNNVRVQIVTILCFLGALNLVQLWHRDLKNGKQYDAAVDFHVFDWCWMSRRKLFNLPTQVLPPLWASIQRVVNVTRTLESESCVEMPRPKGAKPSIWHHPERKSELWRPKTIENVAITDNMR